MPSLITHIFTYCCRINEHGTDFLQNDQGLLGRLLLRRISSSLQDANVEDSLNVLGAKLQKRHEGSDGHEVPVHPVEFYIVPPVKQHFSAGDLFREKVGDKEMYWVLIHPTCDMVPKIKNGNPFYKAERVLLCRALLLSEQEEYILWKRDNANAKKLQTVIKNNRASQPDRFWFLPGVLNVPNMVLDFQEVNTVDFTSLGSLEWVASLDSPFAENLIISYSRYKGRIGIPVVDCNYIVSKIQLEEVVQNAAAGLDATK